jgi:hypothetical protein
MLRNIWTAGLLLFAVVMASTFFITKVWQVSDHRKSLCAENRQPSRLLWSVSAGRLPAGCESIDVLCDQVLTMHRPFAIIMEVRLIPRNR